MEEELAKLKEISNFFKRMNQKVKLIRLLETAKREYENFNLESGQKTLEEAYEIDPKNPTVLRGFGCIKQSQEDYDSAIEYYKKALNFSEHKEIEYTLIGTAYYAQEKLDDAVEYFNLAIDINDNYTEAYEGRNQAMLESHVKILDLQQALKKYF